MGVSIYYQAIPEQSALFRRVQTQKAISTLFDFLFPYGNGIFHIFDIDKEELDEILDEIAEYCEVFDSRADVDQCLNELRMELERANISYPGLADRNAYLEKIQKVIEERLSQELKRRQLDNHLDYVEKLLYGNQALAPFYAEYKAQALLVPSSVVRDSMQMLKEIDPEALFEVAEDPHRYYLEEFRWWREFYLEVAEKGEAAIVMLS